MPRLAIIDNKKLKIMQDKLIIQSKCPINRTGADCMYFEGEKLLIDEILCTGCGICVKYSKNEAIKIINLPDMEKKQVIHQYGKNGFRIFDLPLITKDSILGIIGKNGIGKSSVINVLSSNTKANFGNIENQTKDEDYFKILLEKYKGSALFNYFNDLKNEKIKISYKIQQIIDIPKMFKGKVVELLLKIEPDKNKIENLAKPLGISKILQREIEVLSGGELQRVAILSTLLKSSSNLFIFDEITNYLDIFQRINCSKIIQKVVKDKSTIVIEHDLVVLDYLCDYVHLMYGESGAYGMLSGIKAGKVGINDYLKGFLKEENVKFRDKPIVFDKLSITESQKIDVNFNWEDKTISRGDFKLDIKQGDIKVKEIIGIIGENALGKSTFIKDIIENDNNEKVLSYKEQIISRNENLVLFELSQFENYTDNFYDIYILKPLRINELLEKQIDQLSGGELQRFAIAKCLLKKADLYLFDEPTAFLDIEDRLNVSKILKNFIELKNKSAFVIDHDLVFMDYISDKLLVFQGEASIKGYTSNVLKMKDGMNLFLKDLNISFRRDENNKRPRVNKIGSVADQKQKEIGEFYYI